MAKRFNNEGGIRGVTVCGVDDDTYAHGWQRLLQSCNGVPQCETRALKGGADYPGVAQLVIDLDETGR